MLKVVFLVALAFGSYTTELQSMNSTNMKDFMVGLITGLGNGATSTCSASLSTMISIGYKVAQDFAVPNVSLQQDINTLNDMQSLVTALGPVSKCDFSQLDSQVKKIFSKGGMEILIDNYLTNGATIFNDYHAIETCSTNYNLCGIAVGNAFKLLVGWSLN